MKNEINLLPKSPEHSGRDSKEIKLLRYLTVGSLGLISFLTVGVFLMTALSPLPALQREEAQKNLEFDAYHTQASKFVLTQGRLNEITKIIKSRIPYGQVLENLTAESVEGLTFSSVKFDAKSVELTVTSPSLSAINTYVNAMKAKNDQKLFKNLSISDLNYKDILNTYSVTVSVAI